MPANITLDAGAVDLLKTAGWPSASVVSVDRDSILFLTGAKPTQVAHTAWLHHHPSGRLTVVVHEGFEPTEPEDLHYEPPPTEMTPVHPPQPPATNHGLAG